MSKKTLKLYVWEGVLTDYSDGIVFALAENVNEARKMAYKQEPTMKLNELDNAPDVYSPLRKQKMCIVEHGGG